MDDRDYISIIADLKFIAQVQDNEYLNTKSGMTEPKNWINSVIRGLKYPGENGKSAAEYCKKAICRGLDLHTKYINTENSEHYVNKIKENILDAKQAIARLKKTHQTNNLAVATFEAIEARIDQHFESI